jgi:hypothetical protein
MDSGFNMLRAIAMAAIVVGSSACERAPSTGISVQDLLDDRVTLDGVLMKCNHYPRDASIGQDCHNARIAIERLATARDETEAAKKQAEFEHHRDRVRAEQEQSKRRRDESQKVDPYKLPLVPADPAPPGAVAQVNP